MGQAVPAKYLQRLQPASLSHRRQGFTYLEAWEDPSDAAESVGDSHAVTAKEKKQGKTLTQVDRKIGEAGPEVP